MCAVGYYDLLLKRKHHPAAMRRNAQQRGANVTKGGGAMQLENSLSYELDCVRNRITFSHVGWWSAFLVADRPYSFEEAAAIFENDIFEPGTENPWPLSDSPIALPQGSRTVECEFRGFNPDEGRYQWYSSSLLILASGMGYGNIQDVSELKKRQKQERYLATHDPLTGLLNRRAFEAAVRETIARADAQGRFVILDIDNFKQLNDAQGHLQGDKALRRIAALIHASVPKGAIAGRFGGDEFVICCDHGIEQGCLAKFADAIISGVAEIGTAMGSPIGASLGVCNFPAHGTTYEELLECADAALMHAKRSGKAPSTFTTQAKP